MEGARDGGREGSERWREGGRDIRRGGRGREGGEEREDKAIATVHVKK